MDYLHREIIVLDAVLDFSWLLIAIGIIFQLQILGDVSRLHFRKLRLISGVQIIAGITVII